MSIQRTSVARRLWNAYAFRNDPALSPRHGRAVVVMAVVALLGSLAIWGYAVLYAVMDWRNLWPASILCMAAGVCFLLTPAVLRRNVLGGCVFLLSWGVTFFTTLGFFFGGEAGLNLGMFTGCVLALLVLGTSRPVALALIIVPTAILGFGLPFLFADPALQGVTPELVRIIFLSNVATLSSITAMALFLAVRQVEIAETALAAEHARSEGLLRNLLPDQIANRLKAAPSATIADDIPQMSLLFADIVDFTPRASRMSPEDLVAFLNGIFSAFDELTARHGLEKIKTIGDAYMVAAGLPVPRTDHATAIADMALDMLAAARTLSRDLGDRVELRIGLHTGPAVAGVIGTTKVFYDVWGDTVNTASRLESHGAPGRIQVTGAARAALGAAYSFAPNGCVDIKGLGPTETWWLTGRAAV